MREKLGACSFCMKWSIRFLLISALAFTASIWLRFLPLILITASILAFFSILTALHLIFYVKRREKCIRRVSGESRRKFISTALKLIAGLALYSIIGRIPEFAAKPEGFEKLGEGERAELVENAGRSVDYANIINRMKFMEIVPLIFFMSCIILFIIFYHNICPLSPLFLSLPPLASAFIILFMIPFTENKSLRKLRMAHLTSCVLIALINITLAGGGKVAIHFLLIEYYLFLLVVIPGITSEREIIRFLSSSAFSIISYFSLVILSIVYSFYLVRYDWAQLPPLRPFMMASLLLITMQALCTLVCITYLRMQKWKDV